MKNWKCPICNQKVNKTEAHVQKHIDDSYRAEESAFQETQKAKQIYKKLFNEDPA